jgi:hypothetical protein
VLESDPLAFTLPTSAEAKARLAHGIRQPQGGRMRRIWSLNDTFARLSSVKRDK